LKKIIIDKNFVFIASEDYCKRGGTFIDSYNLKANSTIVAGLINCLVTNFTRR